MIGEKPDGKNSEDLNVNFFREKRKFLLYFIIKRKMRNK